MQQYDYSKLLGRIREMGYTQERFAKEIGTSACSFNLKVHNKSNFRQDEILKSCIVLNIPPDEVSKYFFTHKL